MSAEGETHQVSCPTLQVLDMSSLLFVLVVVQPSSEVPEGLKNYSVLPVDTGTHLCVYIYIWRESESHFISA
jgi:hypothetical protein